jgi:hypothetical protein
MHTLFRPAPRALAAAALLAVLVFPSRAGAQEATGSFQRTLTVSGPVDLEVLSGSGSIEVRAGQAGRIEISGRVRADNWRLFSGRLNARERVRRIEAKPPIEQTGNRVTIGRVDDEELRDQVSISYTLVVPPDTTLVSKTGSGSHLIEGAVGRHRKQRIGIDSCAQRRRRRSGHDRIGLGHRRDGSGIVLGELRKRIDRRHQRKGRHHGQERQRHHCRVAVRRRTGGSLVRVGLDPVDRPARQPARVDVERHTARGGGADLRLAAVELVWQCDD